MIDPDMVVVMAVSFAGIFGFLFRQIMTQGARITVLETRQTDIAPAIKQLCGEIRTLHVEIATLKAVISQGNYTPTGHRGATNG